jgi:hypothetical protein
MEKDNTSEDARCQCFFCKTYPLQKWATVMECGCSCHDGDGLAGHSSLCCPIPNALKKNNPYKNLEKAEVYEKKINDYFGEEVNTL